MPHEKKNSIADFYEDDAIVYDKARFSSKRARLVDQIQKSIVLELSGILIDKRILEIGTGTGRFAIPIAKNCGDIICVDITTNMLKTTRKKALKEDVYGKISLIRADADCLPLKKKTFDKCICINVLNHLPNYVASIREIARVLKPDAGFIANFPNMYSVYFPIALLVKTIKRSVINPVFSRWFSIREVYRTLIKAGFRMENIQGHMGLGIFLLIPPELVKFEKIFRKSWLKYFSGILFVKSRLVLTRAPTENANH